MWYKVFESVGIVCVGKCRGCVWCRVQRWYASICVEYPVSVCVLTSVADDHPRLHGGGRSPDEVAGG